MSSLAEYTTQQIINKYLCVEKNQRFLLNIGALNPSLFSNFSHQVPEVILNEYSKNTENAL
jgi:hypothetical protein